LNIKFYIRDLLLKRDGLVIPGLGSFITEDLPSKIDSEEKKILPPRKKIKFNPSIIQDDDYILANTIAQEENISLDEANKAINDEVMQILEVLNSLKTFEFPGIGKIMKDDKGAIRFEAEEQEATSFGLIEIEAEPLEKPTPQPSPKTSVSSQPGKGPPRQPKRFKKNYKWYWIAATVLVMVGIGVTTLLLDTWSLPDKQTVRKEQPAQKKIPAKQESKQQKEALVKSDSGKLKKIDHTIDKITDKKQALLYKEDKEQRADSENTYHLIVGSFKKRANAEEFLPQVEKEGYHPKILERDGLYRITVQSFNNKHKALVSLYHMRDTGKIKSVWLLTVPRKDP